MVATTKPFLFVSLLLMFVAGCDRSESHNGIAASDPRLAEFADMLAVDRAAIGLPPLPQTISFWVERTGGGAYDVMLHVTSNPQRTIAFKRVDGQLKWVHEQVIVEGPRPHETPDGTLPERITLTYETAPVSGAELNRLNVLYTGPDFDLYMKQNLTAKDVQPLLDQWAGG